MKTTTLVKHKHKINAKVFFAFLLSILIFCVLVAMVTNPETYTKVAMNSILVWATVLLPTLLPFLLYTKFLSGLGFIEPISKLFSPITKKFYNTSGISSFVYLISIMSGYPVGAKVTTDLFLDGRLNRGEAKRIISYCANCGPMFIIGTVGVGFLTNKYVGYIMLISHFLGAILNGFIYRKYAKNDIFKLPTNQIEQSNQDYLSSTVTNAVNSMFVVGCFVLIFFILIEFLNSMLNITTPTILGSLLNGLLEITHGCKDVSLLNISMRLKSILCCFILSFGGLATAMQSITFLKKINLNFAIFLLIKFTHALISTIICTALSFLFL